jgi:hypothetical protein
MLGTTTSVAASGAWFLRLETFFAPPCQVLFMWSSDAWHQCFRARTSELWATDTDKVWCPSIRRVGCPVSCFRSSLYCVWWASDASVAESIAASVACEIDHWFFNWVSDAVSRVCCLCVSESVAPESAGIWSSTALLVWGLINRSWLATRSCLLAF